MDENEKGQSGSAQKAPPLHFVSTPGPLKPTGGGCPRCGGLYGEEAIAEALRTCPGCGYHYRMEPVERLGYLSDPGSFSETSADLRSLNPIELFGYEEKLSEAEAKSQMKDAVITGTCTIEGRPAMLALMSFAFMGGSMGSVVGEKISRAMLQGGGGAEAGDHLHHLRRCPDAGRDILPDADG